MPVFLKNRKRFNSNDSKLIILEKTLKHKYQPKTTIQSIHSTPNLKNSNEYPFRKDVYASSCYSQPYLISPANYNNHYVSPQGYN